MRCGSLTSWEYDFDWEIYDHPKDTLKPLMQKWMSQENEPGGLLTQWGVTVGGLKFINNGWGDFNPHTPRGDVHLDFGIVRQPPPSVFDRALFMDGYYPVVLMLMLYLHKSMGRIG